MGGKLERRAQKVLIIHAPSALLLAVIFVEAARVSWTTEKSGMIKLHRK
jgi:hypothetical protein